jgi:hypothetical protein
MEALKAVLLKLVAFGAGFALIVCGLFGFWTWRESRSHPPRAWDTHAIQAKYERVVTEGDDNELLIFYSLTNNTDYDYTITSENDVSLSLKSTKDSGLIQGKGALRPTLPFYLPARQTMRFELHMAYQTPNKKPVFVSSNEEMDGYQRRLEQYVAAHFSTVTGFVMFDARQRYQVDLPVGWVRNSNGTRSASSASEVSCPPNGYKFVDSSIECDGTVPAEISRNQNVKTKRACYDATSGKLYPDIAQEFGGHLVSCDSGRFLVTR